MAKLTILKYPDPFLKKVADFVELSEINDELRRLVSDMFETMYADNGGGLAATQVGIKKRIFIMSGSEDHQNKIIAINPKIVESKGVAIEEEGCLSFPGVFAKVKRYEWVKMEAMDEYGSSFEIESDGYLGRCIQHEMDHLNGITYLDHLSPLKRSIVEKKYYKYNKE
jgi:peptide deformylase